MTLRVSPVNEPIPSSRLPATTDRSPSWVQAWLVCLAYYFPIYFACQVVLFVFPALIRIPLLGYRLKYLELGFSYAIAISTSPVIPGDLRPGTQPPGYSTLGQTVLLVLGCATLLIVAGRRHRTLTGLALAMLGQVALMRFLPRVFFTRQIGAALGLASLLFFAVLALGLGSILDSEMTRRYWVRVATLLAAFSLPLAAIWGWEALVRGAEFPRLWLPLLLAPSVIASFLVSLPTLGRGMPHPSKLGWRLVGPGVGITLLLGAAVARGGRALTEAFQQARVAAVQAEIASLPEVPPDSPYPKLFFQKGVSFTAQFPDTYDSEGARRMLEALPQYGVNAVALVPYGFSPRHQPVVHINGGMNSWENDAGLAMLSRVAHARGIKVLLKPAVWLEGENAGDLNFTSPADRAKWFASYRLFLEHYARLAKQIHADLFCVGGEFVRLTPFDGEWRALIARVRELYPGPLVYAANFGPEFESLTFWDALDYIGLQEYYPLPDNLSMESIVRKVEAVQQRFQRPVVFTEAGFSSYEAPNREPWDDSKPRRVSPEAQARCYEAVLQAFYHKPWFQGVYWWAVRSDGRGGPEDGSLTPWGKPAMDVVARWYLREGR
jgi:hypothetical protein